MFYVEKKIKGIPNNIRNIHTFTALIVLVLMLSLTLLSAHLAQDRINTELSKEANLQSDRTISSVNKRLASYEDILRGASGLFGASNEVSRAEWAKYISSFELEKRYPGSLGVGYIKVLKPNEVAPHEEQIRSEGYANYSVHPAGERSVYTGVEYFEPQDQSVTNNLGFDMTTVPERNKAINTARDSGDASISDRVILLRDKDAQTPAIIIFFPIYKSGATPKNTEERVQNITGYVYAPLRTEELLSETIRDSNPNYAFWIKEDKNPKSELYKSEDFDNLANKYNTVRASQKFTHANVNWNIETVISPKDLPPGQENQPTRILWSGIIISLIIAGLLYLLLLNRARALSSRERQNIQDAKNELIALASHQLRTPATGVKQYVGMLQQGYAGNLTKKQAELVDKAYRSNERQLRIINEILVIAQADAGQLKIQKRLVNINQIVDDSAELFKGEINKRKQIINIEKPNKAPIVNADANYLRMAIENIISNATKYTPSGGKITIRTTNDNGWVSLRVEDTGVGVERKDLPLLFRKFSRIPNELTGQVSGSGIGLYLAKQILLLHGGTIEFESGNTGSIVTMRLRKAK